MGLALSEYGDLWKLVGELKKPFGQRDTIWMHRRQVRYRRLEDELRKLPLNPHISDKALMVYQSEIPNQEVHKRVKRLVANKPRFEVVVFENDPEMQHMGQEIENGVKALYDWMNRGKVPFDVLVTQFQQGDGLGIGKLEWVPGHGETLAYYENDQIVQDDEDEDEEGLDEDEKNYRAGRNQARSEYRRAKDKLPEDSSDREAKAYDKVTDDVLRKELPPIRLIAVDPLACYWWEDGDGVEVIAEVGKRALNPLLAALKAYGVELNEKQRLQLKETGMDVTGQTVPDTATPFDFGQMVNFVEIRTRHEIAILIEHPKLKNVRGASSNDKKDKGIVLRFDNPFGPYTTGYVLVPADVTTEAAEEDKYQPPILGSLAAAQQLNVLTTARISAALADALAPSYIEVTPEVAAQQSAPNEDKSPTVREGTEVPVIPGKVKRVESHTNDLDKADQRLLADVQQSQFQEVLTGEAASDATGHRLALQVAQADIQLVPYQNARRDAIKELMIGCLYAIRTHGLTVYIPSIPSGRRQGTKVRVAEAAKLTPEMADAEFDLLVSLGAETPVTKYAKWQAMADREERGTLGYQTVMEESDIEDVEAEIIRVFEGKALKETMNQTIPLTVQMIMESVKKRLFPPPPEPAAPPPGEEQFQADPATGLANGGGAAPVGAPEDMVRLPGVNMPITQSVSEDGIPVPEPMEAARVSG